MYEFLSCDICVRYSSVGTVLELRPLYKNVLEQKKTAPSSLPVSFRNMFVIIKSKSNSTLKDIKLTLRQC